MRIISYKLNLSNYPIIMDAIEKQINSTILRGEVNPIFLDDDFGLKYCNIEPSNTAFETTDFILDKK